MNIFIQRVPNILVLSSLLVFSLQAGALTLAEAEIKSALNQPLKVDIPIFFASPAELGSLNVSVRAGTAPGGALPPGLRHELVTEGDVTRLAITTRQPVREPLVQFVLELAWSGGRVVRDYTLLLNPACAGC